MREIKFRVWDGNSMTNSQLFSISMTGKVNVDRGSTGIHQVDYELMQFTSLTDKNGVDIFEGDIVAFGDDIPPERVGLYGEIGSVFYSKFNGISNFFNLIKNGFFFTSQIS